MQLPNNPPSRGIRYFLLISLGFMFTMSTMMVISNVNIDQQIAATIRHHASKVGIRYSVNPNPDYFIPACIDCGPKPQVLPNGKLNFTSVFGNYNFPQPNCAGKLLVYECSGGLCGGLGDREKGIMSAFLLALLTGRTFIIDHRKPCDIKKFMEPNLYDWSKCLSVIGEARKKGQRLVHYIDGSGSALPKNYSRLKPGDMWAEHVVTIHVNIRIQQRLKEHPDVPTKLPWLRALPPEVIITGLMHHLFKIESTLDNHIASFLDEQTKNGDRQLVAVHIRSAFLKKERDIPVVFKFLEQYADTDKYVLYVACDRPEVRDQARNTFKNFVNVNRAIIHIDSNHRPCDGVYTAVFEQQVLSRADVLVMTPSGFSRLAAYIRGTSDNIFMLEIQHGEIESHFNKIELKQLPIIYLNA